MSYTWDIERINYNRKHLPRRPVKAFKGGTVRKFKSIAHARDILGVSRAQIIRAADLNLVINGYELEWD